jgi:hypothetical protein
LQEWFLGSWGESQGLEKHVFFSTIAYMLKDFYFCNMDASMIAHHTVCIITSLVVLFAPSMHCVGGITCTVCVLEVGSLSRNAYFCFPSSTTAWFYIWTMQSSNAIVGFWTVGFWPVLQGAADYFACCMCLALVALRIVFCFTGMRPTTIHGWRRACHTTQLALESITKQFH